MKKIQHEQQAFQFFYNSPVGVLRLETIGDILTRLDFHDKNAENLKRDDYPYIMNETIEQLDKYFAGNLKEFTIKFRQQATPFRQSVYAELVKIPYGETISYKELAARIGNPTAVRAVGGANHHNRISIVIPCHRVIAANGTLAGYGGGIDKKEFLLELEKKWV